MGGIAKPSETPPAETVEEPTDKGGAADESAEGTSEEDKEGVEGKAKSEEGKNGDKESKATRFFDPKKVPAELRPTYDAMQSTYTQKMQKAALAVRKAEAFDELVNNPKFQSWAAEQQNPTKGRSRAKASSGDDDDDDGDSGNGKGTPDIEAMIEKAVSKALAPVVQREYKEQASSQWKGLLEKYPQAENYKADIAEAMRETPGLSYEKAFKQVAFDDATELGSESTIKAVSDKKKANTGKPSNISAGEKKPGQAKSIPEAFQQALKASKDKERG